MLSAKPWKLDAVIRLLVGVFICFYAGSLVIASLRYLERSAGKDAKFYPVAGAAFVFLGVALVLSRRPWTLETVMSRLIRLLACLYTGFFLAAWAQQMAWGSRTEVPTPRQMLISLVALQGSALVFVALFLREHQIGWSEGFGFSKGWLRAALLGVAATCVFLPIGYQLQHLSVWAMNHWHLTPEEQLPVQILRGTMTWGDRVALGVMTVLLVPVAEEALFRGILYPWIKQAGFPRVALWGTAVLFALVHWNLESLLPLFVLALTLVALYEWTDNLLAPISAHALFNGLNFALLYWGGTPAGKG